MKKIKELLKGSPIAIIIAGVLMAGLASAAVLTFYGSTQGSATDVQQSVLFGDGGTSQTYDVGNSNPVAGNVYYDLETLVNNASDKSAVVELSTGQCMVGGGNCGNIDDNNEDGVTTSYLQWNAPEEILTGERPTAVYNPYDGTGYQSYKKYEVWYKTSATNLHYAYYHPDSSWNYSWDGADTDVNADYDAPFVMKEDGKYYMVNYGGGLTGNKPSDVKSFYIWTSDNGTDWTMSGSPIYTYPGTWYKIDNPKIMKDGDIYRMYFQMKQSDAADTKYYIFEATSTAKSLKQIAYDAQNGTKDFSIVGGSQHGGSVLAPSDNGWDSFRVMQPMVFKPGNKGYLMLYTGYDKYDTSVAEIGYAVSNDGDNWTKVKVSREGYDTNLGIIAHKTSVVKTNDNLVLFYQNGDKIDKTWLVSAVDSSNKMTLEAQEIKPFFIQNDFAINLAPGNYTIKTTVNPAD